MSMSEYPLTQDPIIIKITEGGIDGKSLRACGEWSAEEPYNYLDLVYYEGSSYVAMKTVPEGTLPTDTEYWMVSALSYELLWGNIHGTLSDQTDLKDALDLKANAADVYSKTEADALLDTKADKADTYTKTETDTLLSGKADVGDSYTKAEEDTLLAGKANVGDSYTKAQEDALLADKANVGDSYTKAEEDTLLALKADKSDTYTKTETNTLLNAKADVATTYTKTETDNLLATKANASDVYTKAEADTLLSAKADTSSVYSKSETDTLLSAKADSADVYTKTETDGLLVDKATVIEETATGTIVTIADGSPAPVKALTVAIEPVQDLHGYDNPWPAGGGKNLLNLSIDRLKVLNTVGSWSGNVYSRRGIDFTILTDDSGNVTSIKANGTATNEGQVIFDIYESPNSLTLPQGSYKFGLPSQSYNSNVRFRLNDGAWKPCTTTPLTLDYESETSITLDFAIESGQTVSNLMLYPILCKDTDYDGTFYAYSNICPISGWSTAKVTRTGKNLCDYFHIDRGVNTDVEFSGDEDGLTVTIPSTSTGNRNRQFSKYIIPAGTYAFSVDCEQNDPLSFLCQFEDIQTGALLSSYMNVYKDKPNNYTITLDKPYYVKASVQIKAGTSGAYKIHPQIEIGSTRTECEPYSGTSVTIDLDGTRYGGTLDVLTGVLTVDRASITYDGSEDESWTQNISGTIYRYRISNPDVHGITGIRTPVISNEGIYHNINNAVGVIFSYGYPPQIYYVPPQDLDTIEKYKTWLASNNLQVVYSLATPVTVQLTAQQMTTLLGDNVLWADAGDTTVTYRANSKLYIDQQIADANRKTREMMTTVTNEMVAPKNLVSGDLVIVGDDLYKATANVASGSTLTVGTNVSKITLAEYIQSLL